MGQIFGLTVGHALSAFQHGRSVAADKHRVLGQIGKGGSHFGINLRQISVGSREITQFSQRIGIGKQSFFQLVGGCLPTCQLAQGSTQTVDTAFRQCGQRLAHRQNGDGRYRLAPALGQRVKTPQRIHIIAPELGANRLCVPGGEHIQNTAAEGKLTGAFYLRGAGIASHKQTLHQAFHLIGAVRKQGHSCIFQSVGRQGAQHQGIGRGAQHPGLAGFDLPQGRQTLLLVFMGHTFHIVEHQITTGQERGLDAR